MHLPASVHPLALAEMEKKKRPVEGKEVVDACV
jgi:hypothetical protein